MPSSAERVCGDGLGTARPGERSCPSSDSRRAMEIGGTRRCQQLADEMERNHADTQICVCADAGGNFCAFRRPCVSQGASRRGGDGLALLLTFKLVRTGEVSHCTFDTRKAEGQSCSHGTDVGVSGYVSFSARYVKREAGRVQLAIKTLYSSESNPGSWGSDALASVPEEEYWLEPDRILAVHVTGLGPIEISGQFLDYMPAMSQRPTEPLDPGRDEFRLWYPVLISENRVVADLSGFSTTDTGNDAAIWLYAPGLGRFVFSSVPFEGATEGKIQISQMSFTLEGRSYRVLTGAPISRTEQVWVLHQPDWKSTSVLGSGNLRTVLESK